VENLKCKGARDLLPQDMERFRFIENVFRVNCRNCGFDEVKTPTLEYLFLFTSAGTLAPELLNRVYSFLDWDGWSGERVVLRPDGTIPIARLFTENYSKQKSAKLFYQTSVFSFEETGVENREKWQCGVERIGDNSIISDVETILLARQILELIGIKNIKIKLSHAGILNAIFADMKLNSDQQERLINQIKQGNWKALARLGKENANVSRILEVILNMKGKSVGFLENLKALPNISATLSRELYNFAEIAGLLDGMNCQYRIDFTSSYGFEYYTGIDYQFFSGEQKIGGGGRYNDLVPLTKDKKIPACGFALYIDTLMELIRTANTEIKSEKVVINCPVNTDKLDLAALELAQILRKNGFAAEIGSRTSAKSRWIITLKEKQSLFVILDTVSKSSVEKNSASAVLKFIKETSKIDKSKN
jgi:histidyl-tRNA synthetase